MFRRTFSLPVLGWLLVLAFASGSALAHPMPSSVLLLDVHEHTVGAELQVPLSELGLVLKEDLLGEPDAVLATYGAQLETAFLSWRGLTLPVRLAN